MHKKYYLEKLYPFQDEILKIIGNLGLDFYLTGGTALSRCYLKHRYSDDLDFFVNNRKDFKKQCGTTIEVLKRHWVYDVTATSDTFMRIFLQSDKTTLKIDFVNDVPFHFGEILAMPIFHRVDNWRNILSNKLCALSRMEAKDIVDIIFIARNYAFQWEPIINESKEKDLWVDPIKICRIIDQCPIHLLETIKWVDKVDIEEMKSHIKILHDDIFMGTANSLVAIQNNAV